MGEGTLDQHLILKLHCERAALGDIGQYEMYASGSSRVAYALVDPVDPWPHPWSNHPLPSRVSTCPLLICSGNNQALEVVVVAAGALGHPRF